MRQAQSQPPCAPSRTKSARGCWWARAPGRSTSCCSRRSLTFRRLKRRSSSRKRWRRADRDTVIAPIVPSGLRSFGRYLVALAGARAASLLHLPRPRLTSVLDNEPLRMTARGSEWIDWPRLHKNVADGLLTSVAVVTTRVPDGRTVVFVEAAPGQKLPPADDVRGIDYVKAELGPSHLVASCAIPALFPAEAIPPEATDGAASESHWYVDGGVRLNTPIKPALQLGAQRVVVVATDRAVRPSRPTPSTTSPDVVDAAAQFAHSVMADRMIEDLATLVSKNRMVAHGSENGNMVVPYRFLGPLEDDAIPETAARVYAKEYRTVLQRLRRPDFPALSGILGGSGISHDDLLSYIFFDREFMTELVELGMTDAGKRLAGAGWLTVQHP
jgi:NTE family protein